MNYILTMAILICWPIAVMSFFLGIFIGFPYGNGDDLMQKIVTWPQLFGIIPNIVFF